MTYKNEEIEPVQPVHIRTRQGGVVTIIIAELRSTKPALRLCTRFRISSNSAGWK